MNCYYSVNYYFSNRKVAMKFRKELRNASILYNPELIIPNGRISSIKYKVEVYDTIEGSHNLRRLMDKIYDRIMTAGE